MTTPDDVAAIDRALDEYFAVYPDDTANLFPPIDLLPRTIAVRSMGTGMGRAVDPRSR